MREKVVKKLSQNGCTNIISLLLLTNNLRSSVLMSPTKLKIRKKYASKLCTIGKNVHSNFIHHLL